VLLLLAATASAETNSWQGKDTAAPTSWEAPANWSSGTVPADNDKRDVLIPAGVKAYPTLTKDAMVDGSVTLEAGASVNLGEQTLSLHGSLICSGKSAAVRMGEKGRLTFTGPDTAYFVPGDTALRNVTVDKPNGELIIKGAPLEISGNGIITPGTMVAFADGGELWLYPTRGRDNKVLDPGLRLNSTILPAQIADVSTLDIGPAIPKGTKLTNVAPTATLSSQPYATMLQQVVDTDEKFRTLISPETGLPANNFRLFLRFPRPQVIAAISWAVPTGPWALLADCDGDGAYETLLRMDLTGKYNVSQWADRQVITNRFWPPVKAFSVMFMNPKSRMELYDIKVLSSSKSAATKAALKPGVPTVADGPALDVPVPPVAQQFTKGFHIEPWMFSLSSWVAMKDRPPLADFKPFKDLVEALKKYHANYVNLWPPRDGPARGTGTYEMDVIWPSKYEKHSTPENYLKDIAAAFEKEGITFFTMDRVSYPKDLSEFPPSPTRDLPAPYITRQTRESWAGFTAEQAASGANGIGIGFDEQYWTAIRNLKVDDYTRKVFTERYGMAFPEKAEDTPAYRRWLLFAYNEFASYLQDSVEAARKVNQNVVTNSPVTALDTLWNQRIDWGVAHDIIGHQASIDVLRSSGYFDYANIGHYVTGASVKRAIAATSSRGATSLHNCPWANDPVKYPGFYLHFPPVYMYSPLSAFMNGAKIASFWRYNFIYYGGYDKPVQECFAMLDTLAAWGMKEATTPQEIVVLKSRASEDWWQVHCRYNPVGDPMDQYRGFINEKWTLQFLFTRGYPFEMRYLDHPEDLQDLAKYKVIIVPFAYSISNQAGAALTRAAKAGAKLIVIGGKGEVDEFGDARATPLLAGLLAEKKTSVMSSDLLKAGYYPAVAQSFRTIVDSALGKDKQLTFNSYGDDVEVSLLAKGVREKYISTINWTDRPVTCDLSVNLPAGRYQVSQADAKGARSLLIRGREVWTEKDLKAFRLPLDTWQVKALYIHPAP